MTDPIEQAIAAPSRPADPLQQALAQVAQGGTPAVAPVRISSSGRVVLAVFPEDLTSAELLEWVGWLATSVGNGIRGREGRPQQRRSRLILPS